MFSIIVIMEKKCEGYMKLILFTWGMIVASVALNSFGAVAIKSKLNLFGPIPFNSFMGVVTYLFAALKTPLFTLGIVSIFAGQFCWLIALSRMDITLAYPVAIVLNLLIVVVSGLLLFQEAITGYKVVALLMLFMSLILFV